MKSKLLWATIFHHNFKSIGMAVSPPHQRFAHHLHFQQPHEITPTAVKLIDDLSFSYYFHCTGLNQALHFCTLAVLYPAVAVLLGGIWLPADVPVAAVAVFVPYAMVFLAMEWRMGSVLFAYFAACVTMSSCANRAELALGAWPLYAAAACVIVLPPLQLVGHVFVERRLPA